MSVSVVYWSGTGNTQAMAEAVAEGIRTAGQEAALMEVSAADPASLASGNAFALGCPSMGAEQLEETEMEPFIEALEPLVSGKNNSSVRLLWLGRRRMDAGLGRTHEKCGRSACTRGRHHCK